MHYATGADGLAPAPFVLSGTTEITLDGDACKLVSSVVLPNGAERVVEMKGSLRESPARLEGDGPIALLLSEVSAARTLLVREVNRTSGASVLTSSLVMVREDETPQLLQTAHELSQEPGGGVTGVQMWKMVPMPSLPADENDEEAFMYSGSQL